MAPKNLGSKIVHHKSHVQAAYDHELVPVDQKGRHLPRKFPDHWPSWLPKSWQMTFDGLASDPSFRSPSEELFNSEEAVKRHLVEIGALEKPKAAPKTKAKAQGKARQKKTKIGALPEPAKKLRRLRKLAPEECQVPEVGEKKRQRLRWAHGFFSSCCAGLRGAAAAPEAAAKPPPAPSEGGLGAAHVMLLVVGIMRSFGEDAQ